MLKSPRKSVKLLQSRLESQEELNEMQTVCPMGSSDQDNKKKKKKQQKHQREKRAASVPDTCTEESLVTVSKEGRTGEKCSGLRAGDSIARGIFKIEKNSCDVVLTATRLIWTQIQPETPTGGLRFVFTVSMAISGAAIFSSVTAGQQCKQNTS